MNNREESWGLNELQFIDGDIVNFSVPNRVRILEHTVEFREMNLDDETKSIELAADYDKFVWSFFPLLRNVSNRQAISPKDSVVWWWNARVVPQPHTMNAISIRYMQPLGAHALPFILLAGDRKDESNRSFHKNETVVRAIAEGFLPVSTDPFYFKHDMGAHALGLAALDYPTMEVIQTLCAYALDLEMRDPVGSHHLMKLITHCLDYYTYEDHFVAEQRRPISVDPLLSDIFKYVRRNRRVHYQSSPVGEVREIMDENGFRIKNEEVIRSDGVVKYYDRLNELLALSKPIELGELA